MQVLHEHIVSRPLLFRVVMRARRVVNAAELGEYALVLLRLFEVHTVGYTDSTLGLIEVRRLVLVQ